MHYNIKGTNVDISDELRQYVEKKLAASEKFVHDTARMDIELEYRPNQDSKKYRAECMVEVDGKVERVEAQGGAMHEAIDIATGELARDLSQIKKKRQHVLRRSAMRVKEYLRGFRSKI